MAVLENEGVRGVRGGGNGGRETRKASLDRPARWTEINVIRSTKLLAADQVVLIVRTKEAHLTSATKKCIREAKERPTTSKKRASRQFCPPIDVFETIRRGPNTLLGTMHSRYKYTGWLCRCTSRSEASPRQTVIVHLPPATLCCIVITAGQSVLPAFFVALLFALLVCHAAQQVRLLHRRAQTTGRYQFLRADESLWCGLDRGGKVGMISQRITWSTNVKSAQAFLTHEMQTTYLGKRQNRHRTASLCP